jgi:hypothetical protein
MRIAHVPILVASSSPNASWSSSAYQLDYVSNYSVQLTYTNSCNGVASLGAAIATTGIPTEFAYITGSSAVIAGSGKFVWNLQWPGYDYYNVSWVPSTGLTNNGKLTVDAKIKGL